MRLKCVATRSTWTCTACSLETRYMAQAGCLRILRLWVSVFRMNSYSAIESSRLNWSSAWSRLVWLKVTQPISGYLSMLNSTCIKALMLVPKWWLAHIIFTASFCCLAAWYQDIEDVIGRPTDSRMWIDRSSLEHDLEGASSLYISHHSLMLLEVRWPASRLVIVQCNPTA